MSARTSSALAAATTLLATLCACAPQRHNTSFRGGDGAWRSSELWRDGKAERCEYQASRVIYGAPRSYRAIAYTNVERYDAATTTKSEGGGREVFKHHWSEIVPTENYDYRFSTCTYTDAATLQAVKLTVGTQEDCGASFKQVWLAAGRWKFWDSVYFPGAGTRSGQLGVREHLHFVDELTLLLRDCDFAARAPLELELLPSQKTTRQAPFEPQLVRVEYVGEELLTLPIGAVATHHLRADLGALRAEWWFAAESAAPWMNVLARYSDSAGVSYELSSMQRTAYWERP